MARSGTRIHLRLDPRWFLFVHGDLRPDSFFRGPAFFHISIVSCCVVPVPVECILHYHLPPVLLQIRIAVGKNYIMSRVSTLTFAA